MDITNTYYQNLDVVNQSHAQCRTGDRPANLKANQANVPYGSVYRRVGSKPIGVAKIEIVFFWIPPSSLSTPLLNYDIIPALRPSRGT